MRLRHKTTTAVIDGPQWNEDHVCALYDLGNISGPTPIDLSHGSVQIAKLAGNVMLILPTAAAGTTEHLTLIFDNDSTGGRAITVSGAQWVDGEAPDFDGAPNARNILVCRGVGLLWICDGGRVA